VFVLHIGSNGEVIVNVGDIIEVKTLSKIDMLQLHLVPFMYFV